MDFSKLKKSRGSALAKMTEKLESMNKGSGGGQQDDRIFKPGFDRKEGKGYALIRFIPNSYGDPFVRVFSHAFKGSGGWYFEKSRSTIGEPDPVGISNKLYWDKGEAEGVEKFKNIARSRKRNTRYYANVYVIKDTINPDNNGKVMIYEFGPQIFKIIESAIKPEFEDDEAIDPFDFWSGADFKIKIVGKEIPDRHTGNKVVVPNYENSEFDRVSELFEGDDEKKEEIFNQAYSLAEFTELKSFEELAEQFKRATGEEYNALEGGDPADNVVNRLEQQAQLDSSQDFGSEGKTVEPKSQEYSDPNEDEDDEDDDDDVMAMFQRLANQQ